MNLRRILQIFRRNERITVLSENGDILYSGAIWLLDNKYLLSCLVVDVYRKNKLNLFIVVIAD